MSPTRARRPSNPPATAFLLVAVGAVLLSACADTPDPAPPTLVEGTPPEEGAPAPVPTEEPGADQDDPAADGPGADVPSVVEVPGPALPEATAEPVDVVTGLATPWDLAFLPGGAVVVTTRDRAAVVLVRDTGVVELTGPGADALRAGTDPTGEGGLLGVEVVPSTAAATADDAEGDASVELLLYRTAPEGNEVVRATLDADEGTLGELSPVLTGIPAGRTHNGGRIAVGPDGMLWVATGDAGVPDLAQDPDSLGGKVLRVTLDGEPAPDNPTPGSPVYSLGHRNVQGLGWDADGALVATEFGQNRIDELNVLEGGGNYGWPLVEGVGGGDGLVDPVVSWAPADASPSGLAVTDGAVWVAALRGQRLWQVPWADGAPAGEPVAHLVGELGRLRHVEVGPDGALWLLTQNTDGRGQPRDGDDRLVRMLPPG